MAKIIKYDSFKRGDTPVFAFAFTEPTVGYSWAGITVDAAITDIQAPVDNVGAGVIRLNQSLTIDASNTATFTMQPTVAESKALTPGSTYKVEIQLKQSSGAYVTTPVTGQVLVEQDYII